MKTMLTAISATLAASAVFLAMPTEAHALGPIDVELGAKVGYATSPDSAALFNPYGFGMGARGGVSLFGIYVGGNFMYYLGGSATETIPLGTTSTSFSVSGHALQYGVEAGYGFSFAILTLRPQIGVGNFGFTGTSEGQSLTSNYLYVEPGVTALISLGVLFVGADVNGLIIPSVNTADATGAPTTKTYASLSFHGQVGVKF